MQSSSKTSAVLFLLRLIRTSVAIFNLVLSAKYFGATVSRDTWILAFNYITVLNLAVWGPLDETFRAKYIFIRESESEEEALRKTSALFNLTTFISFVIVFVIILFPTPIAKTVAPAYSGVNFEMLVYMIRLVAPIFVLTQITKIWTSILNAHNSFYIPEIAGFISAVINLILLLVLVPTFGIYSLVISAYVGLFVLAAMLIYQIKSLKIPLFRLRTGNLWQMAKPFIMFSLPFFLPYFFGQISGLVEKSLTSVLGQGQVSVLDYAKKFTEIPLGVLTSILTTVLVPVLSTNYSKSRNDEFVKEFKQMLQLGLIALCVLVSMLTVCARPIVELLYAHGAMTQEALTEIEALTGVYSLGAICVFLYLICGMALISVTKGKLYAFSGVIAQILMIITNIALYRFWGIYTFAYSLIISHFLVAGFMFYKLPIQRKTLLISFAKYFGLLIGITAVLSAFSKLIPSSANHILSIILHLIIVFILLITAMLAFNLDESRYLRSVFARLKRGEQQ